MADFVHPEVLVCCDWVEQNRSETDSIRLVESDEDILLYEQGHIAGAVKLDWTTDLQDAVVRDYVSKGRFEELCAERGISNETIVVFYGDKNNWWACYAFWAFKLFGHEKCLIMNGGRKKWELDKRPMTREASKYPRDTYKAKDPNDSIRAFRNEVLGHMKARKPLVDVRSPGEYTGELLHMPDYPQEAHCVPDTFPARSMSLGAGRATTTVRSRAVTSSNSFTLSSSSSNPATRSLHTAASASDQASPGTY